MCHRKLARQMKEALWRYINGGFSVSESRTYSEGNVRRIGFVNYISLISIVNMVSYTILYMVINFTLFLPAIIFLSVSSLIAFGIILFNNKGFHAQSKILVAFLNPIFIGLVSTWIFGSEPGFQTFLFAAIIIPLFFWSAKDLKYLIFFVGLSLLLYIYIQFFPPLFKPLIELPDHYINVFRSSNILITFCASALAIIVYFELSNKQEKRLVQQAHQLEISQQHRDLVYSIVAHDLKSPLARLSGLLDLLLRKYEDENDDAEVKFLRNIHSSSKALNNLLDNLLNWSRMHSGNMVLNRIPFKLKKKVNEVEKIMHDLLVTKKITLSNKVDENINVLADPDMISTVLRNFISNAIKFTVEGGEIWITAKSVNKTIEVCIQDTGVGISVENIKKLFNEKTNLITSGTNNEKGSGLGLKLCKDFIEANDGKVWVESELNKGSKFLFTLPTV
jgi:signal transduction histidine kinase